jgi:uncharacterized protein YjiS (DUF1127 family)
MHKSLLATWPPAPAVRGERSWRNIASRRLPWSSYDVHRAARARRARVVARLVAHAWHVARAFALRGARAWARYREARATYTQLHQLDDRTLRDLGFSREEIGSVVAELGGDAEHTRLLTRQRGV